MKVFYLQLFLLLYSGFAVAQPGGSPKYFEGIVEYTINGESYMQGVSNNEIRERIGATLRLYFKNGNYMREYVDGAGYTLRKMFYRIDKNLMYDYNPIGSPDTIYIIDPSEKQYLEYKVSPGKPETVLDYQCNSSIITAKYYFAPMQDTSEVRMTYFFAKELPVNPAWSKNFYIWEEIIKEHKSIAIKFIEEEPLFLKQTYTATRIQWQPVPDDVFTIDPKLVQVKAPNP